MKPGVLGALAGVAIAASVSLWSCTIDRPSDNLKCIGQADCGTGRICQGGYCIIGMLPVDARELDAAVCPTTCNGGCDFGTTTCTITGTGTSVVCPADWNCVITCPSANSCGAVNCGMGASCKVNCASADACAAVSCVTNNCDVTCTGVNACGNVSCTSGNCTQSCTGGGGSASCGTLTCTTGDCTRTCAGSNACGTMSCTTGACTETCSGGSAACGALTCGTGQCSATCQGADPACGDVSCSNSCQCDVSCDLTNNECPATMTCPQPPGGTDLCQDTFGTCDSSQTPNKCRKCI